MALIRFYIKGNRRDAEAQRQTQRRSKEIQSWVPASFAISATRRTVVSTARVSRCLPKVVAAHSNPPYKRGTAADLLNRITVEPDKCDGNPSRLVPHRHGPRGE